MRKDLAVATVGLLLFVLVWSGWQAFDVWKQRIGVTPPGVVACTMEAKLCPDGSSVGRVPPLCDFAPCPGAAVSKSGVSGKAILGPTCPVERIPPDPACAPKPYHGSLAVTSTDGSIVVASFETADDGSFTVELPPGEYAIRSPLGAPMLPRCSSDIFTVNSGAYTDVPVSCDTGIR